MSTSGGGKRPSFKADAQGPLFVAAMLKGATVAEAAQEVGVSRSTGRRWFRKPECQEFLRRGQRDIFDAIARAVTGRAREMLEVLAKIANDEGQDGRSRVQAARTFIEFTLKFRGFELEDLLSKQLEALEGRLRKFEEAEAERSLESKRAK